MFSKFFIDRPIFATVIAILMVIVGLVTMRDLPVAQFPDITPPTVSVSASYPGANAATVARSVGVPIEEQVNGVEGMLYMSSTSGADGSYNLQITFENGTDIDIAAVDVQNRVSAAEATLPESVKQQGVTINKESSNIVLFVSLEGDKDHPYDALFLTNYANMNITEPLTRVDGVGAADAFGGGSYSMRVWLDPEKMRAYNISPQQVQQAIESQNMVVSAGSVGAEPNDNNMAFEYTLSADGQLATARQFADIIVRSDNTGILRVGDLGSVDLGSQTYSTSNKVNGEPSALIGIRQLPGANALEVSKGARAELDRLAQYFPPGVHYKVVLDSTTFVDASINEVVRTFVETSLIVLVVLLLFLQNWRSVIIPMLTIPVSLIATFAVMKLLGFTINTLTLFGLVLAIAIVVDDAIVVVEDCARLLDKGKLTPRQAAEKAMTELTGPVVGEVLVLLSVFLPTAFISGITGQLYKQFALTIAISTAFSGFNALTFTPAMCALFLKPRKPSNFFVYRWFNKGYNATIAFYKRCIHSMLASPALALGAFVVIAGVAFWGFLKLPTSYIPSEDMGYFMCSVQLPQGASLERTERATDSIASMMRREIPDIENIMLINGMSMMGGGNTSDCASMFVTLKPWHERKGKSGDINDIIDRCNAIGNSLQEVIFFAVNPPSIPGLGSTSGLEMQLLDINNLGPEQMVKAIDQIKTAAEADPRIASINTQYQGVVPQYQLLIDRDRVELQGLDLDNVYSTLSAYTGSNYSGQFIEFGRVFQVTIAGDALSRGNVEDIMKLSVPNSQGDMVPFTTFAHITPIMGEPTAQRYNMYGTAGVTAIPTHGTSSSEAIKIMEDIVDQNLGENYSYAWTGEAYQETQAGTTISTVFIFAIILTILFLAAQYESWSDPIAVVLSMPMAILGVVLGCLLMGQSVSIYSQIGLILLLGLSAKNAILIVEYAIDYRKTGLPIRQAAEDAGVVRFRPIMMTALAFIFGVMPMLFASGAGAASRIAIGAAVVFGMAMNAIFGTLFVPNFWELMTRIKEKLRPSTIPTAPPPSAAQQSADASEV